MPVRETAARRIISTAAGVATFSILRKMLSLPVSRCISNGKDADTVYLTLIGSRALVAYDDVDGPSAANTRLWSRK